MSCAGGMRRTLLLLPALHVGFSCGSAGKESACNGEDLGSISWKDLLGRSPGEVKGYPLQNSGPENSTDCIVHGVAKSQRSDFHFHSKLGFLVSLYLSVRNLPNCACRRLFLNT